MRIPTLYSNSINAYSNIAGETAPSIPPLRQKSRSGTLPQFRSAMRSRPQHRRDVMVLPDESELPPILLAIPAETPPDRNFPPSAIFTLPQIGTPAPPPPPASTAPRDMAALEALVQRLQAENDVLRCSVRTDTNHNHPPALDPDRPRLIPPSPPPAQFQALPVSVPRRSPSPEVSLSAPPVLTPRIPQATSRAFPTRGPSVPILPTSPPPTITAAVVASSPAPHARSSPSPPPPGVMPRPPCTPQAPPLPPAPHAPLPRPHNPSAAGGQDSLPASPGPHTGGPVLYAPTLAPSSPAPGSSRSAPPAALPSHRDAVPVLSTSPGLNTPPPVDRGVSTLAAHPAHPPASPPPPSLEEEIPSPGVAGGLLTDPEPEPMAVPDPDLVGSPASPEATGPDMQQQQTDDDGDAARELRILARIAEGLPPGGISFATASADSLLDGLLSPRPASLRSGFTRSPRPRASPRPPASPSPRLPRPSSLVGRPGSQPAPVPPAGTAPDRPRARPRAGLRLTAPPPPAPWRGGGCAARESDVSSSPRLLSPSPSPRQARGSSSPPGPARLSHGSHSPPWRGGGSSFRQPSPSPRSSPRPQPPPLSTISTPRSRRPRATSHGSPRRLRAEGGAGGPREEAPVTFLGLPEDGGPAVPIFPVRDASGATFFVARAEHLPPTPAPAAPSTSPSPSTTPPRPDGQPAVSPTSPDQLQLSPVSTSAVPAAPSPPALQPLVVDPATSPLARPPSSTGPGGTCFWRPLTARVLVAGPDGIPAEVPVEMLVPLAADGSLAAFSGAPGGADQTVLIGSSPSPPRPAPATLGAGDPPSAAASPRATPEPPPPPPTPDEGAALATTRQQEVRARTPTPVLVPPLRLDAVSPPPPLAIPGPEGTTTRSCCSGWSGPEGEATVVLSPDDWALLAEADQPLPASHTPRLSPPPLSPTGRLGSGRSPRSWCPPASSPLARSAPQCGSPCPDEAPKAADLQQPASPEDPLAKPKPPPLALKGACQGPWGREDDRDGAPPPPSPTGSASSSSSSSSSLPLKPVPLRAATSASGPSAGILSSPRKPPASPRSPRKGAVSVPPPGSPRRCGSSPRLPLSSRRGSPCPSPQGSPRRSVSASPRPGECTSPRTVVVASPRFGSPPPWVPAPEGPNGIFLPINPHAGSALIERRHPAILYLDEYDSLKKSGSPRSRPDLVARAQASSARMLEVGRGAAWRAPSASFALSDPLAPDRPFLGQPDPADRMAELAALAQRSSENRARVKAETQAKLEYLRRCPPPPPLYYFFRNRPPRYPPSYWQNEGTHTATHLERQGIVSSPMPHFAHPDHAHMVPIYSPSRHTSAYFRSLALREVSPPPATLGPSPRLRRVKSSPIATACDPARPSPR
ncbi:hypothetical protein PAPYR_3743 [Paratrimastix pyriformis]|uniref:Uncharacterized protein n=1 Tax=Paratrimastix pyriformis TaxID=342808 RepID=A0ABQ8UMJ0_9EUKA|nr:hypothetical protein PAPYR_3743 [Paratrimastix pyriformis]